MLLITLIGAILVRGALAHQVHGILLVNDTETPPWKYVRDVGPEYNPYGETSDSTKISPQMDINDLNITCGRRAFDSAATTDTADVLAGSEVGFRVSYDGDGEYGHWWHPGPAQIYLSRAPNDDIKNYRGDGEWFKIAYGGPVGNNKWLLWGKPEFNFTIPKTTPPGKYLMRIETIFPTPMFNYSQWYVNCAQVNILGPGGGTPTQFAKFPGTYGINDPGIRIPENQFVNGGLVPDSEMRLLDYKAPGPEVWTG